MDQLIQLTLSLVGIYFLGVLAARFWPQEQALDNDRVARALARTAEPKVAKESLITRDNKHALAQTNDNALALLHIMGDRVTVSPLNRENVKTYVRDSQNLTLTLDNFTDPIAKLRFNSEEDCAAATAWLADLSKEQAA